MTEAAAPNVETSSPKHFGGKLWKILKDTPPAQYRQAFGDLSLSPFAATRALSFPLMQVKEHVLLALPHKVAHAPDMTRDQRLVAWCQACVDLGADPVQSLRDMKEHATGGLGRLFSMRAYDTVKWWRDQGVEGHFMGPQALDHEPTTLATVAFVQGHIGAVEALLPGSNLTHIEKLWNLQWHARCLKNVYQLMKHLRAYGPAPATALSGLARAAVNKANVAQVLATAKELVEEGADPNQFYEGGVPPLASALLHMNSHASVEMVRFLLSHGANPLQAVVHRNFGSIQEPATPLHVALEQFNRMSLFSHLRPAVWECVELLAQACTPKQLQLVLTPARLAKMEETLIENARHHASPIPGHARSVDVAPELARLRGLYLGVETSLVSPATRRSTRL